MLQTARSSLAHIPVCSNSGSQTRCGPLLIFVGSHERFIRACRAGDQVLAVLAAMCAAPHHAFQSLTKAAPQILKYVDDLGAVPDLGEEAHMYLVWKKRKVQTSRPSEGCLHEQKGRLSLVPILVRNRRVNGRPRQEHIAALPSIRTCCLGDFLIRARWWYDVQAKLEWLQNTGKLTADLERPGQDWRREVRESLESKVTYPTPEEWNAFNAQAAERSRQEQVAREARAAADKVRREEQRQQELRRKAEEEERLRQASREQALNERIRIATEENARATELLSQSIEKLKKVRSTQAENVEVRQQKVSPAEPAPLGPENEEQPRRAPKQEVRRARRIRI